MTFIAKEIDLTTGEEFIREMTEEEIVQIEKMQTLGADAEAAREAADAQKAAEEAARLSAKLAIYAKLGLTEEEINTLIS